jgi:hypothetical protein
MTIAAEMMMTPDVRTTRIETHEANLKRYARLLTTELTDLERAFIHNRIAEERLALEKLSSPPETSHIATAQFAPQRAPSPD